jgi:hypothetical protein
MDILYEHHMQIQELQQVLLNMNERLNHLSSQKPTFLTEVRAFFRWLCVGDVREDLRN